MTSSVTATREDASARPPVVEIRDVKFHAVTETECVGRILDALDRGCGGFVVTPNIDHLRRTVRHSEYRAIVEKADLVVADGVPVLWASRLSGTPLPGQVAGSDLITSLSGGAASRGRSVFFLGGTEGAAEGAAAVLVKRFPDLRVAGTYFPPFAFEKDPEQMARLRRALADADPDIVFVGLGSPKQENLIQVLRPDHARTWFLGVGISFSFLTGDVKRAPKWMRRCGLEWVHRLVSEPRRLARRYLVEGVPFAIGLLGWSLRRRFRRAT